MFFQKNTWQETFLIWTPSPVVYPANPPGISYRHQSVLFCFCCSIAIQARCLGPGKAHLGSEPVTSITKVKYVWIYKSLKIIPDIIKNFTTLASIGVFINLKVIARRKTRPMRLWNTQQENRLQLLNLVNPNTEEVYFSWKLTQRE